MPSKDADGNANSEDPDQTAPIRAVRSGSALFAQTYLSENLGIITIWLPGIIDVNLLKENLFSEFPMR